MIEIGGREAEGGEAEGNDTRCLGVLYGFGSGEEFEAAGADYITEDVEGILEFR